LPKISQEIPQLCLTTRSNKLQEKPLEVELNLGDFLGIKSEKDLSAVTAELHLRVEPLPLS
jgi:hypothetical protein